MNEQILEKAIVGDSALAYAGRDDEPTRVPIIERDDAFFATAEFEAMSGDEPVITLVIDGIRLTLVHLLADEENGCRGYATERDFRGFYIVSEFVFFDDGINATATVELQIVKGLTREERLSRLFAFRDKVRGRMQRIDSQMTVARRAAADVELQIAGL